MYQSRGVFQGSTLIWDNAARALRAFKLVARVPTDADRAGMGRSLSRRRAAHRPCLNFDPDFDVNEEKEIANDVQ